MPFLNFEGGRFFILKIFEIAKKSTMRAKTADEAVYAFAAIRELEKENFKQAHKLSVDLHNKLGTLPRCNDLIELNRNLLLFNAPYNFDSFCQYIELDRDPKSRFYMPRRKQLIRMVNTLQKLEDAYARQTMTEEELQSAYQKIDDARDELNSAKSELPHWNFPLFAAAMRARCVHKSCYTAMTL